MIGSRKQQWVTGSAGCLLQDGDTLEATLDWIKQDPVKGSLVFLVRPCFCTIIMSAKHDSYVCTHHRAIL
jgi:hypothetical protein